MKQFLAFTLFLMLVSAMTAASVSDEGCYCIDVYDPVCGLDDKTYSNKCYLNCENVKLAHEGKCLDTDSKIDKD